MNNSLKASKTPEADIARVAYEGQDPKRRQYRAGYEWYFEMVLELNEHSDIVEYNYNVDTFHALAKRLNEDAWIYQQLPASNQFDRTIIGIEESPIGEGKEVVVARWGRGFGSPVHGHSRGFLHEEMIFGRMLVNLYRLVDVERGIVRIVKTDVYEGNTVIASANSAPNPNDKYKRQAYIHNFVALDESVSLHYVPEHTRDGRDNTFTLETFRPPTIVQLTSITKEECSTLRTGDVVLVRSDKAADYGDHYIIFTDDNGGHICIAAPETKDTINWFLLAGKVDPDCVLLKLNSYLKQIFLDFHGFTFKQEYKISLVIPEV